MTTTFTGVCGIAGCPDPTDWDVGPGLCQFHWESFMAWRDLDGNTASRDVEPWLAAAQLEVSHDD
jgi:hypothetical protein